MFKVKYRWVKNDIVSKEEHMNHEHLEDAIKFFDETLKKPNIFEVKIVQEIELMKKYGEHA
jgi:hypothetical protein